MSAEKRFFLQDPNLIKEERKKRTKGGRNFRQNHENIGL